MKEREYELKQDYFEWLCEMVHATKGEKSYWILMKDLFHKIFYSIVPHDENRAGDGLDLREEFIRDSWVPKYLEIDGECSVLEMMIGLARRMDFELSDPYINIKEDRTSYWFWEMIDNLGLKSFDDEHYIENGGSIHVDEIIDRFLERDYKRSGEGGLFPLENAKKDQRQIEIWYQMSSYLAEKRAV